MLGTIIRTALFTAVGVLGVNYLMKGMEDELDAEIVALTLKDQAPQEDTSGTPGTDTPPAVKE